MVRRSARRGRGRNKREGRVSSRRPQVAIIVVNHEAHDYLARALASIREEAYRPSYEVVIVDTSAAPRPPRSLPPHGRWMAAPPGAGFAAATNLGLRSTQAPYLLLLNPDTELRNNAVWVLADYLESHPRAGLAGAKLVNPDGSLQLSCRSFPGHSTAFFHRYSLLTRLLPRNRFTRRYLLTDWDHDSVRAVDWLSGACLMVRRTVLDQVGLLDERFFLYAEDVDLCYRARQAGWEAVYVPGAVVLHHIGGSSQWNPGRAIRERHRSMWLYYRKHLSRNPLVDLATYAGIQLRCAYQVARWRLSQRGTETEHGTTDEDR